MGDFELDLEDELPRGIQGASGRLVEARWLDKSELLKRPEWRYRDPASRRVGGLALGYAQFDNKDVAFGWRDDRHVLTVAGSRAGKGVSLIVPNLLLYDGSVLAIDPKGELAAVTARARREKGQKVVILDPFGENGRYPSGSFNPLAELDPESDTVKDDAAAIADSLIIGNQRDPHWTDSARILVKALILYVLTLKDDKGRPNLEDRHLITVWRLLNLTYPPLVSQANTGEVPLRTMLWALLKNCTGVFDDTVSGVGERFRRMPDKELESVLSTAVTQLEFLDSTSMSKVLKTSDLKLSELKTGSTTLYLCLPATKMSTHSRWLRVIINLALVAFERTKRKPEFQVLMVLDEFAVLGHMKSIETAAGLMAGFGVKLWVVLQHLSQLTDQYPKMWETFVSNAGVANFWGNTDATTKEYISNRLGQTGVRVQQPSGATPSARLGGASTTREELRVQRLLSGDEVERLLDRDKKRILVFASGQYPIILQRIMYFKDSPLKEMADEVVHSG